MQQLRKSHKYSRKWLYVLIAVVLVGVIAFGVYRTISNAPAPTSRQAAPSSSKKVMKSEVIRVAAMGDMIAHTAITNGAKTADGYDYAQYFKKIRPLYKDADIVFCNHEVPAAGVEYGISGYPTFNAPVEFSKDLHEGAGCNVLNLANNHIADKGQAGIDATLDSINQRDILAHAGANKSSDEQRQVRYFMKHGVKFAFLAFADFSNNKSISPTAVNLYHTTALFDDLVKEARQKADVVLVSMHWGVENASEVNADQPTMAKKLAEANVDVVIGTGPHVLQKTEQVKRADGKEMLVWYSLGNMLSGQLKTDERIGVIAQFDIDIRNKKRA